MKKLVFIFLISGFNLIHAQKYNRPVPNTVFPFEFICHQPIANGYFLSSPLKLDMNSTSKNFISTKPIILDKNGFLFWYMNTNASNTGDFKYFPKDSLFAFIRTHDGKASYQIMDL